MARSLRAWALSGSSSTAFSNRKRASCQRPFCATSIPNRSCAGPFVSRSDPGRGPRRSQRSGSMTFRHASSRCEEGSMVTGAPGEKQGGCHTQPEAALASLALILLEEAPRPRGRSVPREGQPVCAGADSRTLTGRGSAIQSGARRVPVRSEGDSTSRLEERVDETFDLLTIALLPGAGARTARDLSARGPLAAALSRPHEHPDLLSPA